MKTIIIITTIAVFLMATTLCTPIHASMQELKRMMCELNIKAGTPELNTDDPDCAGLGYINMTIINEMFGNK